MYDNSIYNKGKRRKSAELVQFRKRKRNHLIIAFLLFFILILFFISAILISTPFVELLIIGTFLLLGLAIFMGSTYIDIIKSHIHATLDVKLYENAIIMPDWDTIQPMKTKLYAINLIDNIFWNEGYDHLLFIKSEKGMITSNDRLGHEMLYKNIIDNKNEFRSALRKTGKLIEDRKMTVTDWLKLQKNK